MLLQLFGLFCVIIASYGQDIDCNPDCVCVKESVRCINKGFDKIPTEKIPENITVLDLRYNQIVDVKRKDLQKLKTLKQLYLGSNTIKHIEPFAFSDLKHLKVLYLFSNNLTEIHENAFAGLKSVEQLYLQNNAISKLPATVFKDLKSLRRLYLQRNEIKYFNKDFIQYAPNLRRLRIGSNHIPCSCELVKLIHDVTYQGHTYIGSSCIFNGETVETSSVTYSQLGCSHPKFVVVPEKRTGIVGRNVTLQCQGTGSPIPTIKWLKDGTEIENNDAFYFDEKTGSLTLINFLPTHAGYYQCVLENTVGKKIASSVVTSASNEALPTFLNAPSDVDAILNGLAVFHCRASGYPRPSVKWLLNGRQLEASDNRMKQFPTGDLEIQQISMNDAGYYTCMIENEIGRITKSARLIVKAPPKFVQKPANLHLLEGETASFECSANGFPNPAIVWQKDGSRLPSDGRHSVLPSGTLRILFVRKSNEGTYECQAINVVGVISTKVNLTIKERVKPKITMKPSDLTIRSGNMIFFQCIAEGDPKPVITWSRNKVQVTAGNRFKINTTTGTIEISDIGKVDGGTWSCAARNSVGFASESFSVTVIGPKDGNYKGDQFVLESLAKAQEEVDRAIELTKKKLQEFTPRSPGDLLALFRFPSPDAVKIARSAEIFEIAIELIQKSVDSGILDENMRHKYHFNGLVSPEHIQLLANLSGCTAHKKLVNCSDLCFHRKYRSYDGSCNNLNHPMWGAALTPFSRLLVPNYENGFNTPNGWNNTDLPSARKVSLSIISSKSVTSDEEFTHMLMQWGQFLDHDLDFTVTSPSTTRFADGLSCRETCENQQPCFPIKIPENDPRIKKYRCMEFTRSSAVCGSGSTSLFFDAITPRQQINQITSFIDASNVYGSSVKDAYDLRSFDDEKGFLKRGIYYKDIHYFLPFNQDTPIDCQVNKSESHVPCFLAGDHRANEQLGLLSMHTLWMRQHNRIAEELKKLNPHWNGEKIYQESRKIVGAQMQHISYNEWLPNIIGEDGMQRLGGYKGYDPNQDPSIFNAFATAAFRFGHTLIQPFLARLDENFEETKEKHLPLHKAFFSPYRLIEEGGIDPLIRGLFATPVKDRTKINQLFNEELTERLFAMAHAVALDLGSLNIQRGRDHGLPPYNSWRQYCNISLANDFGDLINEIRDSKIIKKLSGLYKSVDDIDLMIGGLLENSLPGTRLGPTFLCLLTKQFQALRSGDRFWYENPGVFEPDQLTQIKQTTLARVICENGDNIKHVQRNVFRRVERKSEYLECSQHPIVDLRFWKDCCSDRKTCRQNEQSNSVNELLNGNQLPVVARHERVFRNRAKRNLDLPVNNTVPYAWEKSSFKKNDKKSRKILLKRIEKMQRKISKFEKVLGVFKNELDELLAEFKSPNAILWDDRKRNCITDRNVSKKHGQQWKSGNEECICHNSKVYCAP